MDNLLKNNIIPSNTILLGYNGSIAYGTEVKEGEFKTNDIDFLGVCIAQKEAYIGLTNFEQQIIQNSPYDGTIYELKKYFHLLLKQNPTILSLLWLNEEHYLIKTETGKKLLESKELFSSRLAYGSFIGYAHGQLHRMTHASARKDLGEKRRLLIEKFGYDCKNAGHLIRLLRMGITYLQTGILEVYRKDAQELIDIKTGKWSAEKVLKEADILFGRAKDAVEKSPLPEKPDVKKVEILLMSLIEEAIFGTN